MDIPQLLALMSASARNGLGLDNYGRSLLFSDSIGAGEAQVVLDQWIVVRDDNSVYWVTRQIDASNPDDYKVLAECECKVTSAQAAALIARWLRLCDARIDAWVRSRRQDATSL